MNVTENRKRLFLASCLALIVTSLSFAIRAKIEGVFDTQYGLTKEAIGWAFGPAFWGFTLAMFIGGLLIDLVKTRTVIWFAFVMHLIGLVVLILSRDATTLFISNVLIGLGNGSVEAACNPLIATMFPNNKTKMLNRFHVWFPGGIVIGGLLAWILMDNLGLSWQLLTGLLFIPLALYGYLFFGQKIPETERVVTGVSYKDMLRNVAAPITIIITVLLMILIASVQSWNLDFSNNTTWIVMGVILIGIIVEGRVINKIALLFPLMFIAMFLTSATELGTNQWINALLERSGINPMIILVVITGLMAVGRFFAGPLIHRLNPAGVLLGSSIISALGLYSLSVAEGPVLTMGAAIIFAIGVCYFWPTMLGVVAEYVPKSGALGLSIMGGAGMVATSLILPIMGASIDEAGPQMTLRYMTILPVILIGIFIFLVIYLRNKNPSLHEDTDEVTEAYQSGE